MLLFKYVLMAGSAGLFSAAVGVLVSTSSQRYARHRC
jgi:hypothetical protein